MGDSVAISLGENVKLTKTVATIVVILLSSSSVAIAGPISFIGLITPHIISKLGGRNFRQNFILCGIYGANLLLLSDIISKLLKYPYESPVGTVTSFIGAVFYIFLANKEMKIVMLLVISFISLLFGSKSLNISNVFDAIFNYSSSRYSFIVFEYRIPRLLIAMIVGMSLAIAGAIFQGVLRNPLASTDVLGIGKGAGFFACLVISLNLKSSISIAAMIGGLMVGIIIYLLTKKTNFKNTSIVIMGIAMSALFDAGIQYLNISNSANVQTILLWLTGSVWGRYWDEVQILIPYVAIFVPLAIILANKIDILSLGDKVAINLGENILLLRVGLLLIGIILTASSVSVSGTIGFVGLIAPHIAKTLVGYKHRLVIPLSGLIGANLLVISDIIGRTIISPMEIPVGIVTAIIGAPYFLYLLLRKKAN